MKLRIKKGRRKQHRDHGKLDKGPTSTSPTQRSKKPPQSVASSTLQNPDPSAASTSAASQPIEGNDGNGEDWVGCMAGRYVRVKASASPLTTGTAAASSATVATSSSTSLSSLSAVAERQDALAAAVPDESAASERPHHHRVGSLRQRLSQVGHGIHLPHPHHHHPPHRDKQSAAPVGPSDWGFPGYLNEKERAAYDAFYEEVFHKRDQRFRDAIFCFGHDEPTEYALCRWLRARKFNVEDVVAMLEQAVELREEPARSDFYPDPRKALHVDESVFKTQYPQIFTGTHAKNGCPIFISRPGVVNVHGLDCVTTVEGVHQYQWHAMVHAFARKLREKHREDPSFVRYSSFCIFDLEHLSRAQLSGRVLDVIKHQTKVDGLCFPESLSKLVIVNAPAFFSAIWRIIRHWLDARTANKIEIYSSRSKWEKRLAELVREDQLPSDYGGTAPPMDDMIVQLDAKSGGRSGVARRVTELVNIKSHASVSIDLLEGEEMEVDVYTRSTVGAAFSIEWIGQKVGKIDESAMVKCPEDMSDADHQPPYHITIARRLRGPGKFKIQAEAHKGRFSSSEYYLIVGSISKAMGEF